MANKAKFIVEFDGDTRKVYKAMDGVGNKAISTEGKIVGSNKRMASSFGGILGKLTSMSGMLIGGGALITGIGYLVKKNIDTAESLEKMSQRVGISIEDLSTLRHAAELSGTSVENFEKSIAKQSRGLLDATLGIKEAADAYDMLDISYKDTEGNLRATDEVMMDVADRFSVMEDGGKKTALAMKIFGKSGTELIPMLNGGSEAIRAMQQEARDLGIEISTKTAKEAALFKDNLTRLEGAATGVGNAFLTEMMPHLTNFSEYLVDDGIPAIQNATEALGNLATGVGNVVSKYDELKQNKLIGWLISFGSFGILGDYAFGEGSQIQFTKEQLEELNKVKEDSSAYNLDFNRDYEAAYQSALENRKTQLDVIKQKYISTGVIQKELTAEEQKALEVAKKKAEKLTSAWEKQSLILQNDIIRDGLSPQEAKIFDLKTKADTLRDKYAGVAGAVKLINDQLQSAIEKELKGTFNSDFEKVAGYQDKFEIPEQLDRDNLQFSDTSTMDAYYDNHLARITEVSDLELLDYALMSGMAQNAFGDMTSAMYTFYEMSGKKSKEMFFLYKMTSGAEALVSTYAGATRAFKDLPVPLSFIASGAILVAGLANVARIASLQPGSTGGGGSTSSIPNLSLPSTNNSSYSNTTNNSGRNVNITINTNGADVNERYIRDELIPAIQRGLDDGASLNVGQG